MVYADYYSVRRAGYHRLADHPACAPQVLAPQVATSSLIAENFSTVQNSRRSLLRDPALMEENSSISFTFRIQFSNLY